MTSSFPFDLHDVAELCGIPVNRHNNNNEYITCPFCGRRKKMNFNYVTNQYNCPACNEGGHMLGLYAKFRNMENEKNAVIVQKIKEELHISNQKSTYKKIEYKEEPKESINFKQLRYADKVYKAFLNKLKLADLHYSKLINERRLDNADILKWNFKSVPIFGYKQICRELINDGYSLKGIGGFYQDSDGEWTLNVNPKTTGIIVPAYDIFGLIEALQIRLDKPFKNEKYFWISSDGKMNGVGVKAIPFYAPAKDNKHKDTLVVTEGAFKTLTVAKMANYDSIALAGVNNQAEFFKVVPYIKKMGYTKIIDAFDADYQFKDSVKEARKKFKDGIIKEGFEYHMWNWDISQGKGIDDYIFTKLNV